MLPTLRVTAMRQKMSKAIDLYSENLKLYNKLSSTKTTLPTLE